MLSKAIIPPNMQEHEELGLNLQSYSEARGRYSYATHNIVRGINKTYYGLHNGAS